MAVKTITITTKAYEALKAKKRVRESFSDVISRISGERSLKEFIGALTPEQGEELKRNVSQFSKEFDQSYTRRMDKLMARWEGK